MKVGTEEYINLIGAMYSRRPKYDAFLSGKTYEAETACECGAFKTSGIAKAKPGHSSWCPWVAP